MPQKNQRCFVISPIGKEGTEIRQRSDLLLLHIVKPVLEKNGYDVIRADNLSQPGIITNQIIDELIEADLVIADLTSHNPNVFYELAVRHAMEKPIIHMIEWGQDLPFDIANFRTIFYGIRVDQAEKAKFDLESQVSSIINRSFVPNNPIISAKRFADIQKNLKSEVKTNTQDALLLLLNQVSTLNSKFEKLNLQVQKEKDLAQTNVRSLNEISEIRQIEREMLKLSTERADILSRLNKIDKKIPTLKSEKDIIQIQSQKNELQNKLSEIDNEIGSRGDIYEILMRD